MGHRCALVSALPAVLAAFATTAATLPPDLQDALAAARPSDKLAVIVRLHEPPDRRLNILSQHRAQVIQQLRQRAASARQRLRLVAPELDGPDTHALWLINSVALPLTAGRIRALARLPGIAEIRADATFSVPQAPAGSIAAPAWNLAAINAPALWRLGLAGQGIVVATMDTGADADHPDLAARWRGGPNSWYDPYGVHDTPIDADGHGTHVMGVVLGGDASGAPIGVAPGARWIAVKIFDDRGAATFSAVHRGFQWLVDPDGDPATDDAPDVVNNSWGVAPADTCNYEFRDDIAMLSALDIAVLQSAGNDGPAPSTSLSPGNYPGHIAVGALDDTRAVATASGRGPSACDGGRYPTYTAPGVAITTADLSYGGANPYPYVSRSGSSLAVAHVSGIAALLRGAFPYAPFTRIDATLRATALDLGAAGPDDDYGYGLPDALGAYESLARDDADTDADAVPNLVDNCTAVSNADQRDGDADGYGTACDPDLNNDGVVNFADAAQLKSLFYGIDAAADFNGDGQINFADLAILRRYFYGSPGPAAGHWRPQ